MGHLLRKELREANVRDFLTLKQDSLIFHYYSWRFTQLARYAPEMVANMRSRMSIISVKLSHLSYDQCATCSGENVEG